MIKTVYLETTIVSYLAARPSRDIVVAAHQQITWEWWDTRRAEFDLRISQVVIDEASEGDKNLAQRRLELLQDIPLLDLHQESTELAHALVEEGPIPEKAVRDALHIALAAVHGVDILLTWNCTHIANVFMRRNIKEICSRKGHVVPLMCTPLEMIGDSHVER